MTWPGSTSRYESRSTWGGTCGWEGVKAVGVVPPLEEMCCLVKQRSDRGKSATPTRTWGIFLCLDTLSLFRTLSRSRRASRIGGGSSPGSWPHIRLRNQHVESSIDIPRATSRRLAASLRARQKQPPPPPTPPPTTRPDERRWERPRPRRRRPPRRHVTLGSRWVCGCDAGSEVGVWE